MARSVAIGAIKNANKLNLFDATASLLEHLFCATASLLEHLFCATASLLEHLCCWTCFFDCSVEGAPL
jgi:hypothetical protein